jgi:hypothetical protein
VVKFFGRFRKFSTASCGRGSVEWSHECVRYKNGNENTGLRGRGEKWGQPALSTRRKTGALGQSWQSPFFAIWRDVERAH